MKKILLQEMKGSIINIFIPKVQGSNDFLPENKVDIIAIEIDTEEGTKKLIKPRNSKYSSLMKGKQVKIRKYALEYDYNNYLNALKNIIDNYYSEYKEESKKNIYKKYFCSSEEFKNHPRKLIEYEILDYDNTSNKDKVYQRIKVANKEVLIPIISKEEKLFYESSFDGRSE